MYPFGDQNFGLSEVPWIEVPCGADQLDDFGLRGDAAGLRHRVLYHADTAKKNHPGQVMLVRVPRSPSGENWELVASYARRVVRGEFAAIDIPDIFEELRSKPVIPRDPTASSTWLDTAPGTGARDVERAIFQSLGARTSDVNITRDTVKIIGLYLTRLSYAQKSLNLDHDAYQTIQWLTENWHRGDARSVYLLYHPDEATEDDSRKNYWWENTEEVARKQFGSSVPVEESGRTKRYVGQQSMRSELPWRAEKSSQAPDLKSAQPPDLKLAQPPDLKSAQPPDLRLPQAPDRKPPQTPDPSRTAHETGNTRRQTKKPQVTDALGSKKINPAATRTMLRRLTAKSRQRAAEQRPHELVWKPGKTVRGVSSEIAELPDGTTLSLVTGSRATTSALFHDSTPVASGSAADLHAYASDLHKHVDARKWFK